MITENAFLLSFQAVLGLCLIDQFISKIHVLYYVISNDGSPKYIKSCKLQSSKSRVEVVVYDEVFWTQSALVQNHSLKV
jgi:hypothetical protein